MRTLTFNRVLGSGAMGTVYHAELRVPHGFARQCAVKVMRRGGPEGEPFRARMRDEARLLGMLQDEQVLRVMELTTINGRDCVIMEYVEGVDLGDVIRTRTVPPRALAELGAEIAGTLHRAHTATHPNTGEPLNVIHRDVKPANVMVTSRGGVRLLDFGVARARFDSRESETQGLVLGTLNYFPPEVMQGQDPTPMVDVYGLGLTLWECATGKEWGTPQVDKPRFERRVERRLAELRPEYDPIAKVLVKMLAWDPLARPDGGTVEGELLDAGRECSGAGLRQWARDVVPDLISQNATAPDEDDVLVGQTLQLGSGPQQLGVIDPPVRQARGPEVMTYNDLAPPAAVQREKTPEPASPRQRRRRRKAAPPANRNRPWVIVLVAMTLGTVLGLVGVVILIAVLVMLRAAGIA